VVDFLQLLEFFLIILHLVLNRLVKSALCDRYTELIAQDPKKTHMVFLKCFVHEISDVEHAYNVLTGAQRHAYEGTHAGSRGELSRSCSLVVLRIHDDDRTVAVQQTFREASLPDPVTEAVLVLFRYADCYVVRDLLLLVEQNDARPRLREEPGS